MMNVTNNFPLTVGTAESWPQIWPDEERWQVGGEIEVALWIGVLWQWQVLHQVIVPAKNFSFRWA